MPPPATTADRPAGVAAGAASHLGRLWRGRPGDAAWVRPALLALLVATAVLYLWGLSASEWANSFYSAAAQAGSQSWKAWLFGSSDAANSITVDKPPASLWVMTASVRLFGLSSWSVLAPQALMGVGAVGGLYAAVRRAAGPSAGLVAGAVLALTPVATLMFRYNNPDALLTLLLVVAAYALVRALEGASTRWLVLAAVAVGFGFLTKMLQALLIAPALAGVYVYAAPTSLGRRLGQLVAAGAALLVAGGWYVVMVALWPPASRPYIGGSQSNSLVELTLGYNGFQRLTGEEVGRIGGGPFADGGAWLRLVDGQVGGQIAWLLPAALLLLAVGLWLRRGRARTDPRRASLLLWGGWLLVTAAVFSAMQGIFHGYYTVALAPAVGALVGLGAAEAWARRGDSWPPRLALAATIAVTAGWSVVLLSREPGWLPWLRVAVPILGGLAALAVAAGADRRRRAAPAVAGAALAAVLAAPAALSVSTAATPHFGAIPRTSPSLVAGSGLAGVDSSDLGDDGDGAGGVLGGAAPDPGAPGDAPAPARPDGGPAGAPGPFDGGDASGWLTPGGGPFGLAAGAGALGGLLTAGEPPEELVETVRAGADGYTWAAAAIGSNQAAGVQLAARVPVMPIGGFNGTDPSPTLAQFRAHVADDDIHYFLEGASPGAGPAGFGPARGGSDAATRIREWVVANFPSTTIGGVTVYDLDP